MTDFTTLDIETLRQGYLRKDFTVKEVVEAYLRRMDSFRFLNAYITETADRALEDAAYSDLVFRKEPYRARPLEGIPLGLKDLFSTKGIRTTAASRFLENYIAPYESTVSRRLKEAGTVLLGKLNMDEFAMGSHNKHSYFGPVQNPWGTKEAPLSPGGSSGGSVVAVSARLCLIAAGSDTGGSIRLPAAYTATVGFRPTYGRVSRFGMIAFASSLDQAGIVGRTVKDTAAGLEALFGADPYDSTTVDKPVPDLLQAASVAPDALKGLRFGCPREYFEENIRADVRENFDKTRALLESLGATCEDISLPYSRYGVSVYYVIASAEASANLARFDGIRYGRRAAFEGNVDDLIAQSRSEGFGREVQRRIVIGTFAISSGSYDRFFAQAQRVRRLVRQDFDKAFEHVNLIISPAANMPAPLLDAKRSPLEDYMDDFMMIPAAVAGLPSGVIPSGLSREGRPLGLQVIGGAFDDAGVIAAMAAIQKQIGVFDPPLGDNPPQEKSNALSS